LRGVHVMTLRKRVKSVAETRGLTVKPTHPNRGRGVGGRAADAACGDFCGVYAVPHSHAQEINILNMVYVVEFGPCTWEQA
jgi:hypothetical protein